MDNIARIPVLVPNRIQIWLEYWKIFKNSAKFIIKFIHFVLDNACQISYNPIKHMSDTCVYSIAGALYGRFLATRITASHGDSLNTHGEHVC